MIFVDTSAFLAIVKVEDFYYPLAKQQWKTLLHTEEILYTNNYVVVESIVIIQKRSGINVVKKLQSDILGLVNIDWVDEEQHSLALETVFQLNRRKLSLVDCSAFQTMRRLGIDTVFTFDDHFREEGFKVIPNDG
jgi:predicted nucleic acid-binding protein